MRIEISNRVFHGCTYREQFSVLLPLFNQFLPLKSTDEKAGVEPKLLSTSTFMISSQYKNAKIANFVSANPFKLKKTNKVCNLDR